MKELLVIYDGDETYAKRLETALNGDGNFPFFAVASASPEDVLRFVQEEEARIVLTTEPEAAPKGVAVLQLTEAANPGNPAEIFKYQPLGRIRREILREQRVFPEDEAEPERPGRRETWIGVASPVGRALKTSFSLVLGELLAQNERVLYVNLEPCPAAPALFGREFSHDLSELFYEGLKDNWDGQGNFTETVHGLDILYPAAVPEDIYETDPEFLRRVIRKYAEANGYDSIVLDLGSEYRVSAAFLPILDKLYIPGRNEALQEAKIEEYERWIERVAGPEILGKAEKIVLPAPGLFSRGKADPEQLLFSELGTYVRQMLGGLY